MAKRKTDRRRVIKSPRKQRISTAALSLVLTLGLGVTAQAQDVSVPASTLPKADTGLTDGLNFNLPGPSELGNTTGPRLELPGSAVGSTLFKLDLSDPACATGTGNCLRRDKRVGLGVSDTFTAKSKKGLDLSLKPRAALGFEDGNSSALVGAVIEIGEDLRKGSELQNNTWYFFAGADAEALTYSPNSVSRITSGQFHLQDRIIVGDAQAGLGYRIGDADVSLSYMRREAKAEDFTYVEDAAALSFTWKR